MLSVPETQAVERAWQVSFMPWHAMWYAMIELVMTPVVVGYGACKPGGYARTATQLVLSELTPKVRLSPL